jgi:hypothetical protein
VPEHEEYEETAEAIMRDPNSEVKQSDDGKRTVYWSEPRGTIVIVGPEGDPDVDTMYNSDGGRDYFERWGH